MNLKNLITVADKDIVCVLTAKDGDVVKRYDFTNGKWTTETAIVPEKLITVEALTKSAIYKNVKNNKLISWSLLHTENLHSLRATSFDLDSIYKGFVLNISIDMVNTFSREGKRYMEIRKNGGKSTNTK